jgi:hypothetical protein
VEGEILSSRSPSARYQRRKLCRFVIDISQQLNAGNPFSGFYYVCIDFNPQPSSAQSLPERSSPIPLPQVRDKLNDPNTCTAQSLDTPSTDARQCRRRDPSLKRRNPVHAPPTPPVATMSGFYYHQNSEP